LWDFPRTVMTFEACSNFCNIRKIVGKATKMDDKQRLVFGYQCRMAHVLQQITSIHLIETNSATTLEFYETTAVQQHGQVLVNLPLGLSLDVEDVQRSWSSIVTYYEEQELRIMTRSTNSHSTPIIQQQYDNSVHSTTSVTPIEIDSDDNSPTQTTSKKKTKKKKKKKKNNKKDNKAIQFIPFNSSSRKRIQKVPYGKLTRENNNNNNNGGTSTSSPAKNWNLFKCYW
jgi:hypothetical protein